MRIARPRFPSSHDDDAELQAHAQTQETLRSRLAAFDTLVAGVAHELNNPMTYALVGVEIALRMLRVRAANALPEPDDAIALEALNKAQAGLHRMREVMRGLVTFVHGDTGSLEIIDVRAVLGSAVQITWHQIRHRATLTQDLAEVPPVEANAARLGQVFLNLLANAAEAIPEGQADRHVVRVTTRTEHDDSVIIEVADTGAGIAPETLPRVFDPFFTTKGPGAGPGLGLSIAHAVVRDLGGRISVQSAIGQGTVVRVELPCARAWRTSPGVRRPGGVDGGAAVLVVDDDRLVGEAISLTLRGQCDVTVCTSAREAVDWIAAGQRFDLILCDLLMPGLTGMDLYAEVLRIAPEEVASIVFMTGGAITPRARAFVAGVSNQCLKKPIDTKDLRDLARSRARYRSRAGVR
ncbi:MAG TPA: ATP-binding protein [Polyangiaceae bacterium]|nr:ATP-binding protein [Polyangiaceae bacterium]